MNCKNCGHANPQGTNFCSKCGKPFDFVPLSVASPQQQTTGTIGVQPLPGRGKVDWQRLQAQVNSLASRYVPRLPFYVTLAPYLELDRLASLKPWILFGSLGLPALLGLYSSQYGHIDTTPFIYQVMPIISGINPVLGLLGGIVFGIADIAEKMVTNNIYGVSGSGDYFGARMGYLIAYLAVIVSGVVPGVLARVFRNAARRIMAERAVRTADGGQFTGTSNTNIIELAASALGGTLGGAAANAAAIGLEMPAFYLRPNPDYSCYSAAVGNLTNGIPPSGVAGALGGAIPPGLAQDDVPPQAATSGPIDGEERAYTDNRGQKRDIKFDAKIGYWVYQDKEGGWLDLDKDDQAKKEYNRDKEFNAKVREKMANRDTAEDRANNEMVRKQKENLKILQNIQKIRMEIIFGGERTSGMWREKGDPGNVITQIEILEKQLIKGADKNLYDKIKKVYGDHIMGKTLTSDQIPKDSQILRETISGGVKLSGREIITGETADGQTSWKSLGLRMILGAATGGRSEWVYETTGSLYKNEDYVERGGNSVLEAWKESTKEIIKGEAYGEVVGRGTGAGIDVGGKLGKIVAKRFPNATKPIADGLRKVDEILNIEIKLPARGGDGAAGSSSSKASSEATSRILKEEIERQKKEATSRILKEIERQKTTGKSDPGLTPSFKSAGIKADLSGVPLRDQKVIRMVADKFGVEAHFRPTNPESKLWLENKKAHPKPEKLKTKTITEADIKLGFPKDSKGLVACKKPNDLPKTKPAYMSDKAWNELKDRHIQRTKEYADQADHLRKLKSEEKIEWDETTGIITAQDGKPFAGDHDPFAYTDAVTGKPVSPFVRDRINQELKSNGTTMHNEHVNWDYQGKDRTVQKGAERSEFDTAKGIDEKILKGHTEGTKNAKPLNSYNPLKNEKKPGEKFVRWETSWYTGGLREFDKIRDIL